MKSTLLASSATIEGLQKCLNRYTYSTDYLISDKLEITRVSGKTVPAGIFVEQTKRRYRLLRTL